MSSVSAMATTTVTVQRSLCNIHSTTRSGLIYQGFSDVIGAVRSIYYLLSVIYLWKIIFAFLGKVYLGETISDKAFTWNLSEVFSQKLNVPRNSPEKIINRLFKTSNRDTIDSLPRRTGTASGHVRALRIYSVHEVPISGQTTSFSILMSFIHRFQPNPIQLWTLLIYTQLYQHIGSSSKQ